VIGENIGHGHQLYVLVASQGIDDGLRAAPAATDDAGPEFLLSSAADQVRLEKSESRSAGGRSGLEQRPSGN
jgi:hypothetical protein